MLENARQTLDNILDHEEFSIPDGATTNMIDLVREARIAVGFLNSCISSIGVDRVKGRFMAPQPDARAISDRHG
jgi:hypothetical protein